MKEIIKNNKLKSIIKKKKIIIFVIVILIIILVIPNLKGKTIKEHDFSSVDRICELATLKCYYHNVGEYERDSNGIFNYGYKKFWFEYNGIAELGIEPNEVKINKPNKNGVVKISIPEIKVMNMYPDEKSMTPPIVDLGIFTSITSEEKVVALTEAEETMKLNVESDRELLNKAKNNAKILLEQYVINLGKQIGKEYSVEWI